jgi:transcriptional regulator
MLVLQTLAVQGSAHGWGIAEAIRQTTEDVLQVEEGSLYPALQRMLVKGWLTAEWGTSENNRRARYYKLTPAGRRELESQLKQYSRVSGAIGKVLRLRTA